MITGENLSIHKDGYLVMSIDHFVARPGLVTGIVGPSGCGKSTLLNCLSLLDPTKTGELVIDDDDFTSTSNKQRRNFWKNKAAFIFQDYGIVDEWSAEENVALQENSRVKRLKDIEGIRNALDRVGLQERYAEKASKLSGGEKQRVGIARALYKNAEYVFADEPTASLDAENRQLVIGLLRSLAEQGATVIVATHDEEMISACDYLHELRTPADNKQEKL